MKELTDQERTDRRLRRLESTLRRGHYPDPDDISYIAEVGGVRAFFLADEPYSQGWFYPRYANGRLHEAALTQYMMKSLTPDSLFLDVGAHLGYFSVLAALRAGRVFTIEPQEFLIGRIHRNISANHLDNVTLIHAAAGEAPGFAGIPKVGTPGTRVGTSENLVPVIRLDEYFGGELMPTHVKIDTEGFEYQVLLGARKILETRPVLFIEVHEKMTNFGYDRKQLYTFLSDSGYRLLHLRHRKDEAAEIEVTVEQMMELSNSMVICEPR